MIAQSMRYFLLSTTSGTLLADFDTEEAALRVVAAEVTRDNRAFAASLALGAEDEDGEIHALAESEALIARALAAAADRVTV